MRAHCRRFTGQGARALAVWRRAWRAGLCGAAALLAQAPGAGAAAGAPPQTLSPPALQAEVDALVQRGHAQPDAALAALAALAQRSGEARLPALGRGLVAAPLGRAAEVKAALATLDGLSADTLAAADAALLRAAQADAEGDTTAALQHAQTALNTYRQACAARSDCDYRATWRARLLLARHDLRRGLSSTALEQVRTAIEEARTAGDTPRQALALALASDLNALHGDGAAEQRQLAQALRMARLDGSPLLRAQVSVFETKSQRRRGDIDGARRTAQDGLALARQAGAPHAVMLHLMNVSDALVADRQPAAALKAAEEGLGLARRLNDRRSERIFTHNAALARIGLGQGAAVQRALQGLLDGYRASGARADEALALREFAEAYAAAGDLPTALALYHRERALAAAMMAANRDAALAELRQRHDHEAQERRRLQLERESTLMSAKLDNRAALQRVWLAGAVVLLAAGVLVALMYRRVRELNRKLEHNHAFLRAQSHRDPLTGLTNRRGLHEAAAARGHDLHFEGALLLVDIDHFKRVNDSLGHAIGDVVLVEVARRLADVVRGDDVVVRWGGEEFLICMPGVDAAHTQALAERVLLAVASEPVALPEHPKGALRVTVSVGYGCFPLPPARLTLSLERAINLADMALYTAKNQGRNCAVGIAHAEARDADGLRALEADFDQARHEGRVTLDRLSGPADPEAALPAA